MEEKDHSKLQSQREAVDAENSVNNTWFKDFLKKLVPEEEFGALEISEKNVRYLLISKYDLKVRIFAEIKLEPGVVVKGELKNRAGLISALIEIKKAAHCDDSKKACSPVIVSLPATNFFFNVLELPDISDVSFDEAVRLNISQSMPISLDSAYFDWQNLGVNLKTLQREFLAGVAPRAKIDAFLDCLAQVGFQALALESRSLSLLRNFNYFSQTIEKNITLLLVEIGEDGMSFLVGKAGKLFFDFYLYWDEIPEARDQKITRENLETILAREVQRIIEYFSLHGQEQVTNFSLFSPTLKKELEDFIALKFNLHHVVIALPVVSSDRPSDIFSGLLGASLRGSLIPRELDDIISLMPEGTEKIYRDKQLSNFVSLWSKISIAGISGVVIILGSVFLVLSRERAKITDQLNSLKNIPGAEEIMLLDQEARDFNQNVQQIAALEKKHQNWSDFLSPILSSAKSSGVEIVRLSLSESSRQIKMKARSKNQNSALAFQAAIQSLGVFAKLELPLSSFSQTPQGFEFDIVFYLKNKD